MLSLGRINVRLATSYYFKDDYCQTECQGEWYGKGAQQLYLGQEVDRYNFENLLKGKFHNFNRSYLHRKKHAPGIDLTFAAPKSVSLVYGIGNDNRLEKAHLNAIKKTLDFLESNFLKTRISLHCLEERRRIKSLVVAIFTHHISRSNDPHLHSHCLLFNMALENSQEIKSLVLGEIFDRRKLLDFLYKNELAKNLRQLNYEITYSNALHNFEIAGIDRILTGDIFATRKRQVIQKAKEISRQPTGKTFALANILTRPIKNYTVTREELRLIWQKKLETAGFTTEILMPQQRPLGGPAKSLDFYLHIALDHLAERQTTFDRGELLQGIAVRAFGFYSLVELEKSLEKYRTELIFDPNDWLLNARCQYEREKNIATLVMKGKNCHSCWLTGGLKINEFPNIDLNGEQKSAINFVLQTRDRVVALRSYAGTEKTHILSVLNKLLQRQNCRILALTSTVTAAKTLAATTAIDTCTLQYFLLRYRHWQQAKTFGNTLLLVDEASLMSSRQLEELLRLAKHLDTRLVLQGHYHQLDSMEVGSPFSHLVKNKIIATTELVEIRRQQNECIKNMIKNVLQHQLRQTFQQLQSNIRQVRREELVKEVIREYLTYSSTEQQETLVITASQHMRKDINQQLQQALLGNHPYKTIEVLEDKKLNRAEKQDFRNYQIGDMITFTAQQGAFHKNCFYRVIGQEDNDIICGCTSSKNLRLDISSTQNFTVLRPLQLSLAEGNKVRWTTTLRERSIIRHRSMTVLELNAHKIVLQDSFNNKKIVLDTTDEVVKYLDYDYANICYTVQSRTSKNVLMILDSHRQNLIAVKNFYTGISRTNDHLLLLTDDGEKSLRLLQQRNGIQSNAMDLPSTRILTTKYRMLEEISR